MTRLRRDLADFDRIGRTQRRARRRSHTPAVALAGYTNAGKSSLLNRITGAGVLVEDALFATLDPTVRRAKMPSGREITLADTVGFVRHLPHNLVEAFRTTLAEVCEADVIVHVVDASDAAPHEQISAVREVLAQIGARDVRELVVFNKSDAVDRLTLAGLLQREPGSVAVSAATGEGIDALLDAIDQTLPHPSEEIDMLIPYARGDLIARVHRDGELLGEEHSEQGTRLKARVEPGLAAELAAVALR